MISEAPHSSVIIPHFNDPSRLKLCLDALNEQDYLRDRFEVIVIDNGSDASPRDLVESYAFCRYAEESKPGSYAARNKGISLARGQVLAFTDSDCLPTSTWLQNLVEFLSIESDDHGAIGGQVEIFPANPRHPTAVELYDCVFGMPQEQSISDCHFAVTANMATRREVFDKVGLFDASLKSGGDTEWGHRLREHGLPVVFNADAVVRHPARKTWKNIATQMRRHAGGRHDVKVNKKYRYFSFHFTKTLLKLLFPQPSQLRRIAANQHITNPIRWTKASAVMIALQYVNLIERARLLIGGESVRR